MKGPKDLLTSFVTSVINRRTAAARGDMAKRNGSTCEDCYFRREGLCALPGNTPCPTFRAAGTTLQPPQQPRLVSRPLPMAVVTPASARVAVA